MNYCDHKTRLLSLLLKIREARESRGWTQAVAAEQLGIWREALTIIESGKQRLTVSMLLQMADVYGTTPYKLLECWKFDGV